MRILFVSEKDECRGPMARALAERLSRQMGLEDTNVFDSAGIDVEESSPPTLAAASFMKTEKINIINHRSKPLGMELADGADLILGMTKDIVLATKELVGPDYAPKVVLLNEAIDLSTKKLDIEAPVGDSMGAMRRLNASLSASMGRLVRTLEDPHVVPEYFGAKAVAKKMRAGGGAGPRTTESTIDPEKRRFLANMVFDLLERAYEPHSNRMILEELNELGHRLTTLELEEILRQDLHGQVRKDKDGTWQVVAEARQERREKAKAEARARAQQQPPPPPTERHEEKMTEAAAYEALGITSSTPGEEARKKYRALLKRYHPDKFHDDPDFRDMAEQKARRIIAAWNMVKEKFGEED